MFYEVLATFVNALATCLLNVTVFAVFGIVFTLFLALAGGILKMPITNETIYGWFVVTGILGTLFYPMHIVVVLN